MAMTRKIRKMQKNFCLAHLLRANIQLFGLHGVRVCLLDVVVDLSDLGGNGVQSLGVGLDGAPEVPDHLVQAEDVLLGLADALQLVVDLGDGGVDPRALALIDLLGDELVQLLLSPPPGRRAAQ